MSRRFTTLAVALVGSVFASFAAAGCSSSSSPTNSDAAVSTGGTSGTGGSANGGSSGASGSSGSSGASGSGGSAEVPDGSTIYTCAHQPPSDPGGDGVKDASCCMGLGACTLASSLTGPAASSYGHDSCKASTGSDDLKCSPTTSSLSDAGALGVFDKCQADFGGGVLLEGRCLPSCFIEGNPQAPLLTQGTCRNADAGAGQQLCAPCYNPLDGTTTGACSQKPGDAPHDSAPTPFKGCGAKDGGMPLGTCVPSEAVQRSNNPAVADLKQDECAKGQFCVPKVKAENVNACFPQCKVNSATVAMFGKQYDWGACVPYYLVSDTQGSTALAALNQSTCDQGQLCAPCLNPLMPGMTTGACE